jgi:hypothetical protein
VKVRPTERETESGTHGAELLHDFVHEGGKSRMRRLEVEYRSPHLFAEHLIDAALLRIFECRLDVTEQSAEPLSSLVIGAVQSVGQPMLGSNLNRLGRTVSL